MTKAARSEAALIRRLLGYLQPYISWAVAAVLLLLAHSALGVVGPLLTKVAVDRTLRPVAVEPSWMDVWLPADRAETLLVLVAIYAVVLVLNYVLRASQIHVMN